MKRITIPAQRQLALTLMDWHGGQDTGLYAVASCMLYDSNSNKHYNPETRRGHSGPSGALARAIASLRNLRANANFPECVTAQDEKECCDLASKLETYFLP